MIHNAVCAWENLRSRKSYSRYHHANMCFTLIALIIGSGRIPHVHFVDAPSFRLENPEIPIHLLDSIYSGK
ncbi:hypothetical protein HHK36_027486 [Tetracentron sinense]|uniref:Uncharacterized protein n=1 Tax=Tetracentron sinense TaxID=13715 RepID=A0A835D141_TETSI|nr:hypothetical protein HHK36_027486 [Tetracentron sinense]